MSTTSMQLKKIDYGDMLRNSEAINAICRGLYHTAWEFVCVLSLNISNLRERLLGLNSMHASRVRIRCATRLFCWKLRVSAWRVGAIDMTIMVLPLNAAKIGKKKWNYESSILSYCANRAKHCPSIFAICISTRTFLLRTSTMLYTTFES